MKLGDLVEIEWEDHYTVYAGWNDVDTTPTPVICRSVGYVTAITKKLVVLAPTYDKGSKAVSGSQGRLRNSILKTKVLKGLST